MNSEILRLCDLIDLNERECTELSESMKKGITLTSGFSALSKMQKLSEERNKLVTELISQIRERSGSDNVPEFPRANLP